MADDHTLYEAAIRIVLQEQSASVALVQRHLRLGYTDACALFERMQEQGVVVSVVAAGRVWALSPAYEPRSPKHRGSTGQASPLKRCLWESG